MPGSSSGTGEILVKFIFDYERQKTNAYVNITKFQMEIIFHRKHRLKCLRAMYVKGLKRKKEILEEGSTLGRREAILDGD